MCVCVLTSNISKKYIIYLFKYNSYFIYITDIILYKSLPNEKLGEYGNVGLRCLRWMRGTCKNT